MAYQHTLTGTRNRLKDKKVELAVRTSTERDDGTWSTETRYMFPYARWAFVRQLSASERQSAATCGTEEEVVFFLNWNEEIVDMEPQRLYIVYRKKVYQGVRIDWYEGYKRDIAVYAKTPEAGAAIGISSIKPYKA